MDAGRSEADLMRNDGSMGPDQVRELQRELEKEKMRAQILAEMLMKRDLEAQLRRELGMETGPGDVISSFGKPGLSSSMWSDQRVAPFHNQFGVGSSGVGVGSPGIGNRMNSSFFRGEVGVEERLPFQRKPEAAARLALMGKGQVGSQAMVLAKPMDTSENKRKAAVVSGAPDIAPSSLKKQKHAERNCGLCQVSATSEQGIIDHFNGKKHKAKEAALRRKTGNASVPEKVEIPSKNEKPTPKNGIKQEVPAKTKKLKLSVEAKKRKFQFWCEDCKVGTHSENVMNHHVKGKRHVAKMRAREVSGTVSTTKTPSDCTDRKQDSVVDANEEDTGNSNKELVEVEGLEIKLDDDAKAVHAKEKV